MCSVSYIRVGTILWCIDVSRCLVFEYMYQYGNMSIVVLIYWCIDISVHYCIWINELFIAIDKTLKLTFYSVKSSCEKNLVQYGDSYGFIHEEIILLLSVR